jgi:hypothetical protein
MQIREFTHGSDDYRAACALRQAVLRKPLGLDLFTEDLAAERDQWHFGLFDGAGTLVACAIALPLSPPGRKSGRWRCSRRTRATAAADSS